MRKELGFIALGALLGVILLGAVDKAAVFDGAVESTSGGFIFPDGTIQATAAVGMVGQALVEETGQQGCWDQSGNPISCTGTGQDGESQTGVKWPSPRFTDNGNGTVKDNLTGLIWLKDANCPFNARTWQQALDWVADLNTMSIACTDYTPMTFIDWRLPNVKELLSLVDYSENQPPVQSGHPFVNVQSIWYWSSTSGDAFPDSAWGVVMRDGNVGADDKAGTYYVWPVRGGQ